MFQLFLREEENKVIFDAQVHTDDEQYSIIIEGIEVDSEYFEQLKVLCKGQGITESVVKNNNKFSFGTPENNYTPTEPFTVEISSNPNSALNEGYMTLWLKSGGADSPRQFSLRMKGDGRWFLWEQFIMVGIRTPKNQDPWA